jgi:transcriptional regulator with PAS, ATPase and Fis domain
MKKRSADNVEKEAIKSTLEKIRWNRKQAAKLLGISYNALLYKIQKYDLR